MRDRVLLQTQYRDKKDFLKALRTGYADGTLDPKLAEIYFGERPYEELYDVKSDPAQLNNLINDPNFATEATRHRNLLDEWLSKGDAGESREPVVELEMASNKRWGIGQNAEYEAIRKDSDGDGLSDTWEELNDRNPVDGKLIFGSIAVLGKPRAGKRSAKSPPSNTVTPGIASGHQRSPRRGADIARNIKARQPHSLCSHLIDPWRFNMFAAEAP